MDWQLAAVIVIEALAVAFVVRKMWPRDPKRRARRGPDVPVDRLVRRRRPEREEPLR